MTTLFFVLGALFFIYEFSIFLNPSKEANFIKKIREDKNYFDKDNPNVTKDERNSGCIIAFVQIFYFIWNILGLLMATQWKNFLYLFVFSVIVALVSKIYHKTGLYGKELHLLTKRFDTLVCMLLISEILMVHFHEFSIINYISSLF